MGAAFHGKCGRGERHAQPPAGLRTRRAAVVVIDPGLGAGFRAAAGATAGSIAFPVLDSGGEPQRNSAHSMVLFGEVARAAVAGSASAVGAVLHGPRGL